MRSTTTATGLRGSSSAARPPGLGDRGGLCDGSRCPRGLFVVIGVVAVMSLAVRKTVSGQASPMVAVAEAGVFLQKPRLRRHATMKLARMPVAGRGALAFSVAQPYNGPKCLSSTPGNFSASERYGLWSYDNIGVTLVSCPKCGSTSSREYIRDVSAYVALAAGQDPRPPLSLSDGSGLSRDALPANDMLIGVVKPPLERFCSGYAEITKRYRGCIANGTAACTPGQRWSSGTPWMSARSEAERAAAFARALFGFSNAPDERLWWRHEEFYHVYVPAPLLLVLVLVRGLRPPSSCSCSSCYYSLSSHRYHYHYHYYYYYYYYYYYSSYRSLASIISQVPGHGKLLPHHGRA